MSGLQKCPGCLKEFTSQRAHLSQTANPLCRRLAKKRRSGRSGPICILQKRTSQSPMSQTPTPHHASPPQTPPISAAQVPTPVPPGPRYPGPSVTDDVESSDDDDADFLTDKTTFGWEPPTLHEPETGSDPPSDMELDPPSTPTPPDDVRQRTWAATKVVRFPDARAGEPVGTTSPSHNAYASSLGNPSPSNPYSPFASKVDWDVAEWAKLHGPSSTSFADLLKIDGVRASAKNLFAPFSVSH